MADNRDNRKREKKPYRLKTIRGKTVDYDQNNQYVTIEVTKRGSSVKYNLSLLGVNAPTIAPKKGAQPAKQPQEGDEPSVVEKKTDSSKAQPGALEYRQYLNKIMFKKCTVKLVVDMMNVPVMNKDTGGYYAFLWIGYTFTNKDVLSKGLANCNKKSLDQYSNDYIDTLEKAHALAKNLMRGPVNRKEFEAHSDKMLYNLKLMLGAPILFILGIIDAFIGMQYDVFAAILFGVLLLIIFAFVVQKLLGK